MDGSGGSGCLGRGAWASLRYGSLLFIVVQTTANVLLMRYSKTAPGREPYVSSTVVFMAELLKLAFCLVALVGSLGFSAGDVLRTLNSEVLQKPRETAKMVVPSALYAVQNNLLFVALSNLDAVTYQTTYQLKILTTAVFSVLLLNKNIGRMQWASLLVLTMGVALVQLPSDGLPFSDVGTGTDSDSGGEAQEAVNAGDPAVADASSKGGANRLVGLTAVVFACMSSGLSGVYFEVAVKTSAQRSIMIRNIQLATFSIGFAGLAVLISDLEQVQTMGFFRGYDSIVVTIVVLQALGGLVVSVALKYADNILKVFATSISIVLSTLCSLYLLHDTSTSAFFVIGTCLVIMSTTMYGLIQPKEQTK